MEIEDEELARLVALESARRLRYLRLKDDLKRVA